MIRALGSSDIPTILAVINAAAVVYKGTIPADCWHEPYMSQDELRRELAVGISFFGIDESGGIAGVMGVQPVRDVTLVRHAYVRPERQKHGIGSALLAHLTAGTDRPVLIGTWAAARWAIRFYEGRGFKMVDNAEKTRLLKSYWTVPDRQIETSVVLADQRWLTRARHGR